MMNRTPDPRILSTKTSFLYIINERAIFSSKYIMKIPEAAISGNFKNLRFVFFIDFR